MKTNTAFKNLIFAITLTSTIASCGSGDQKQETTADTTATTTAVTPDQPTASTETFKDFDWNTVPQSTAAIGTFPYISAPEGFIITDKGRSNESKTGYSEMKDFNKLIMFTGASFYNAEGKVAKLVFKMKEREADWNQYSFDSSVDKYMQSIGAKLLG